MLKQFTSVVILANIEDQNVCLFAYLLEIVQNDIESPLFYSHLIYLIYTSHRNVPNWAPSAFKKSVNPSWQHPGFLEVTIKEEREREFGEWGRETVIAELPKGGEGFMQQVSPLHRRGA